jgi:FO synthase
MHAIGRLVLHPLLPNIQTSWVKMGAEGAGICLQSGANDLGGTLMEESITRAAGATHGQEMTPTQLQTIAHEAGRVPLQRTTLYEIVGDASSAASPKACAPPPALRQLHQVI